jgi:hypothetical protein
VFQDRRDTFTSEHAFERGKKRETFGRASLARGCKWIQHDTATDGVRSPPIACYEAVAGYRADRGIDDQLHEARLARRHPIRLQRHDVRDAIARAEMDVQGRP